MDRQSNWSQAGAADELALIRFVLEMQIEFFQRHLRWPSAEDVQREWHKERPRSPTSA